MEDTLSFEDLAVECKPFEPPYTEEFNQYMQESIDASRKAHAEAIRNIANIIITVWLWLHLLSYGDYFAIV